MSVNSSVSGGGGAAKLSPVPISLGESDTTCIRLSLDTVKLGFSDGSLKGLDLSKFDKVVKSGVNDNGTPYEKIYWDLRKQYKPKGLGSLRVNADGSGILEGSAKLLGKDYLTGVNISTWEKWVDGLNAGYDSHGFDAVALFEGSKVYRSDPCVNIRPPQKLNNYFLALDYSPLRNYKASLYEGTGRVITSTRRSDELKDRLTIYDKALEMAKPNNKWLDVDATGVLRIEANIRHNEQARRLYGIKNIYNEIEVGQHTNLSEELVKPILLKEIFKSKKHPIKEIFNNIFSEVKNDQFVFDFFDSHSYLPFYKIEKMLGQIAIARHFDFDIARIISFLKSKIHGNISRYVKDYLQVIQITKRQEDKEGSIERMEELKKFVFEACQ